MIVYSEIYIEPEDKIDWEPSQSNISIWFGNRKVKLVLTRDKARELRGLLSKLIGRSDRGRKRRNP